MNKKLALLFLALAFLSSQLNTAMSQVLVEKNNDNHPYGIQHDKNAHQQIILAAKEIRRYIYLRTDKLLSIGTSFKRPVIRLQEDKKLAAEQYQLKTENNSLLISGGSPLAVLYGAYAFIEKLGVRFYLHGDVIPDGKIKFVLPVLNEIHQPRFELRGIQPFHDFMEGPDWWNVDDYKTFCTQMTKMRMNFIGLHSYPLYKPWKHVNPEPAVWIGDTSDVEKNGKVKFSYPASWANTARPGSNGPVSWGCAPTKTSDYKFGAAGLFETDDYGSDVMQGLTPWPKTTDQCNELFDRTGLMFADVFGYARKLGIKSSIGIETPFWIPDELKEHLKAEGKNPDDAAMVSELYRGIFKRIINTHPLDYFWIWAPERELDTAKTRIDLQTAYKVAKEMHAPFDIATCGWGWMANNFERLDKSLSKEVTFSCINDAVGFAPVTPQFKLLKNRKSWAIPWMEDDTYMTIPQLWVGRIYKDALDASKYGCSGLMGIHWRTNTIAPNFAALAQSGWELPENKDSVLLDLKNTPDWNATREYPQRMLPALAFYRDWCEAQFGKNVAEDAAKLFSAMDGNLPRKHARWDGDGPGAVGRPDTRPWEEVKKEYAFVDEFLQLRSRVSGAGNLDRFDYWSYQFQYMRAMAKVCCTMGKTDQRELVADWTNMMTLLLETVNSPGELGTVANLEQHSRVAMNLLKSHEMELPENYAGKARIIVPTVRNVIAGKESLHIKILTLDKKPVQTVTINVRSLGSKSGWQKFPAKHLARGVWEMEFPSSDRDFEYYISVVASENKELHWPATAPELNQTVVVW
jgi:hypothetical protein